MSDEEISKVKQGVVMVPATAGSIVIAYNLPGSGRPSLSREAYAGIFLGNITKWNDPAIAKDNPGVTLPETAINVAYRSTAAGRRLCLQTSGGHQLGIRRRDRQRQVRHVAGWRGGKGNEGVSVADQTNTRNRRLRRVWLRG